MQEESVQTLLEQAKRILAAARRRVPEELRSRTVSGPFKTTHADYYEDMLRNQEGDLDELLIDWLEDLEEERRVQGCAS